MGLWRLPNDGHNLEQCVERQARDLDCGARGLVIPAKLGIDRGHGFEVVHVVQLQPARTTFGTPHKCEAQSTPSQSVHVTYLVPTVRWTDDA